MADKALSFDGQDDYVQTPLTSVPLPLTIEVWVKTTDSGAIVTKQGDFYFESVSNKLGWYVLSGWKMSMTTITDDAWHYVAISLNASGNGNLYVDGNQETSITEGKYGSNANKAFIGARYAGSYLLAAIIDEVRISNVARTPEEILANWNNGLGKRLEVDEHTVALWHMDEDEGGTIFDETENDNDGTIVGASWVDGFPFPVIVIQYNLTASSTNGGSVTTPSEGVFSYESDTNVAIIAEAIEGYEFVNWTGTGVDAGKVAEPSSAETTILMDADYTVIANFQLIDVSGRIPYNIEFCQFKECGKLKENGKCEEEECIYNDKWIRHWGIHGKYPPNGGKDA